MSTQIHGSVDAGYEPVRDAFAANFTDHGDVGAAFCLYVDGRAVVDVWGGLADDKRARPWDEDTLTLVYSTTKGVTAICAHLLAQRGLLDLDAPVVGYWPEFAKEGKETIPVRWLLSHRAGLPVIDAVLTPEQALAWEPAVDALAAQAPVWEPGTRHGYHALTYGWLVGEVIRRATGKTVGQIVADELSRPLGLDLWVGLPESEEPRVSRLIQAPMAPPSREQLAALPAVVADLVKAVLDPTSLMNRALNVTTPPFHFNSREVHAAEQPAANGIATARSLARLYAACVGSVDGVQVLSDETVAAATVEQSSGPDAVLVLPDRFGSGFFLPCEFSPLMGPRSFGHAGAGGSLAFADPDRAVGFAYVMNQMQQNLSNDARTANLIAAAKAVTAGK